MDITQIVVSVVGLLAVIITTILIPYIRTKTTTETFNQIIFWVNIAVQAAEQIYVGTGMGEKKKAYVEEFLAAKNINLDTEVLDACIESAVLELKNSIS